MDELKKVIKEKIPSSLPENWEFLLYDSLSGFKNHFNLELSVIEELRTISQINNCWITKNMTLISLYEWLQLYNLWNISNTECID